MDFDYEIEVTSNAQEDFEQIILYLLVEKRSEQAAVNVIIDFEETKKALSKVAGSIKYCDDEDLRKRGYKRMDFLNHNYFMLFRVEDNTAYIDDIFHELQDFKKWMR